MKKTAIIIAAASLAIVLGCVIRTEHKIDAHITLDIRHIANQAENVLDFIEGKTDTLPGLEEMPEPVSWLDRAVNALNPIQVAHAGTLKVTTSPRVQEIAVSMRNRNDKIEALKRQACLGENNRGYAELRDCEALDEPEKRNEAQKLVAEENNDRKALYNEIARLNREAANITVATVEGIYAMERLRRAKSGELFQLPPPGDNFNAVKESSLGRRLDDKCVPNAWITIP